MKICSLASGSSGNSYFIGTEEIKLLIDAGLRGVDLADRLQHIGEDIRDLQGIYLTHEHNDHSLGAGVLARRYKIPVYATEGTWSKISIGKIPAGLDKTIKTSRPSQEGDVTIKAFPIPHDSYQPVGYIVEWKNKKVAFATDIGHMTNSIINNLYQADLLYLESNHDVDMLIKGPYPWHLKNRIRGPVGHLSNHEAANTLVALANGKAFTASLSHLSETNNCPSIAMGTIIKLLKERNIGNITLDVSLRKTVGKIFYL